MLRRSTGTEPWTGSIAFMVTNKQAEEYRVMPGIAPAESTPPSWFMIEGERPRTFAPSGREMIWVAICAPPDAPPGDHPFRLTLAWGNDPIIDATWSCEIMASVPGR